MYRRAIAKTAGMLRFGIACMVILLSGMLQYHHHDASGTLFVHFFADYELAIGAPGTGVAIESHHHDHCCNHNGSQDETECSFHLDYSIAPHDFELLPQSIVTDLIGLSQPDKLSVPDCTLNKSGSASPTDIGLPAITYMAAVLFRGPPTM